MTEGEPVRTKPDPLDLLELDVDLRLAELWRSAADHAQPWTLEQVAIYMRAAYAKGYCDALTEPQRGQLCIEHGYRVPQQRRTPA
jgi:hypothetical protein